MNVAESIRYRGLRQTLEPMSRHTSWRLGGPADVYYVPADLADLQDYLSNLNPETKLTWVGLGSNLLVRDGGIRGEVIAPLKALNEITVTDDGYVYAECGVTCAKLAKICQKNGLQGGEFFAGIPGTVGGALAMNAGAFGGDTWSHVETVTMINRQGELTTRNARDFDVDYRRVKRLDHEWFAAACFKFAKQSPNGVSNIRQLLQKRNDSQPIGEPSCGSVFKNPEGEYAAQLIEASGLKGYCLGNACISGKHANFIISNAFTTATEVESLIGYIQQTIFEKTGILLETEVCIVGDSV